MEILGKLFGSSARIKIMRLFLLNADYVFESAEVSKRSKIKIEIVRKEIALLTSANFLKKKQSVIRDATPTKSKKKKPIKKRTIGWVFNSNFPYKEEIKKLLVEANFLKKEELASRFQGVGKIKLLCASGVFISNPETRVDLMIVGDNIKKDTLSVVIKELEAEVGKELLYALFDTNDFTYRIGMHDKLVRDILDFPHEVIIDSGSFPQVSSKKL